MGGEFEASLSFDRDIGTYVGGADTAVRGHLLGKGRRRLYKQSVMGRGIDVAHGYDREGET